VSTVLELLVAFKAKERFPFLTVSQPLLCLHSAPWEKEQDIADRCCSLPLRSPGSLQSSVDGCGTSAAGECCGVHSPFEGAACSLHLQTVVSG
jgi:hypothetical protein